MAEALVRMIKEQQEQIDLLKMLLTSKDTAWIKHNDRLDKLVESVFVLLGSQTEDKRTEVELALQKLGYCLACEKSPCECENTKD